MFDAVYVFLFTLGKVEGDFRFFKAQNSLQSVHIFWCRVVYNASYFFLVIVVGVFYKVALKRQRVVTVETLIDLSFIN